MKNNKKAQFNEPQICEVAYDDDEDTKCGIGPFQGDWLQKFANKQSYIIVYSIIGTFQSMFFTYFVAVLTTIEKQFRFKSRTTGKSVLAFFRYMQIKSGSEVKKGN